MLQFLRKLGRSARFLACGAFCASLAVPASATPDTPLVFVPDAAAQKQAFVLKLEERDKPMAISNLHLRVSPVRMGKPGQVKGMKVYALFEFAAGGHDWAIAPDECMTPRAFGALFKQEGYDADNDLVCVICCDGGNFALHPVFKADGTIDAYQVKFHLAAEGGYQGLRVEGGPEEFLTNPETMEPRDNTFLPDPPGLKATLLFKPEK